MDELVITMLTLSQGFQKEEKGHKEGEHWAHISGDKKNPSKSSHAQPPLPQASQTGSRQSISPLPAPILDLMGLLPFAVWSLPLEEVQLTMGHSRYLLPRATWRFLTALRPHWDLIFHPPPLSFIFLNTTFTMGLLFIHCFKYFYASLWSPQHV